MKTQSGFTLIEVLIAMLLLAGGLLGLAALQTYTLRSNLTAYNHGQATQLLYDMADRIRTNHCKPAPVLPKQPTFTCNYTTYTATIYAAVTNAYITTNSNTYAQNHTLNTACTTVGNTICTPSVLANNDLVEWNNAIVATLPMGRGSITSSDNPVTVNSVLVLALTWDDDRSGIIDSNDPTFTMSLQP
jgi:type IV pilus assembly protein PilV